jgi:thiol:disulfide interchange protein
MRPMVFVLIVFVSVFAIIGLSRWRTPNELIPWQTDLAAAQAQARQANKPILLYVTASWCGPCQTMRREVWTDQRVADAAEAYVPLKVDIDVNPQVAIQFGATASVPVIMVVDADNRIIRRVDYALQADAMIAFLQGQRLVPVSFPAP